MRVVLWLLLVPALPATQVRIDGEIGDFRRQREILYLRSGEHVRRLCDGLRNLMADVYWLRTVQYFGGQHAFAPEQRFDLLRPLVEITTSLDPRFEIAYRYGATFLSEPLPTGAGDPQAGIEILERGCHALRHSWRLRQDLAFAWFIYMKDPRRGAEVLLEASRLPGAPIWLEGLAADFLRRGGDRQTSRMIWKRVYEQSDEGAIRGNALFHLRRLDGLDTVDRLNAVVEEFVRRTGRRPGSLGELVSSGLLRFVPVDATGVPFEYDAQEGRVSISRQSRLWRRAEP